MRRRSFLASAAAALAAPAIARGEASQVLKFVPQADLAVLDPVWTTTYQTRDHGLLVFDTLFGLDSQFKAQPQMAEGAVSEDDGRTWRITLRPDLLFHDDTRVLARDCVASIRRWGARDGFGQALLAACDEIGAPDDRTIRFRLKHPFPLLPDALAKTPPSICPILPERLAVTDPYKQVSEMVGSGPYRFKADERVAGSRIVYERNTKYVPRPNGTADATAGPKVAYFDRIEWLIMPDAGMVAAAMQNGEIDWWLTPSADLLVLLKKQARLKVETVNPTGTIATLRFNHLNPPFDNPAVRRAVLGAVEQADYMIGAVGTDENLWRDGVGVFCPDTPLASRVGMEVLSGKRDLARVKRDLAAAGYNGEKVVVLEPSDIPWSKAAAEITSDWLRRVRRERRDAGDGLGHPGAASRQDRAGGAGRVEHLPHRLERSRHGQPRRPRVPARQRPRRHGGLADEPEDRGAPRCLVQGPRPRRAEGAGRPAAASGVRGCTLHPARPVFHPDRVSS